MRSPDDLDPLQTLALAYAPASSRNPVATAMMLENRLGAALRSASEPMIAQLKLAWWRERFSQDPAEWPNGEPLLGRLRDFPQTSRLGALVDGYEALLSERLDRDQAEAFARGRGELWGLVAEHLGLGQHRGEASRAGALAAFADLAAHLSQPEERQAAVEASRAVRPVRPLPRQLRPLAIIATLADRALARGGTDPAHGAGAYLAAVRVGMFGR